MRGFVSDLALAQRAGLTKLVADALTLKGQGSANTQIATLGRTARDLARPSASSVIAGPAELMGLTDVHDHRRSGIAALQTLRANVLLAAEVRPCWRVQDHRIRRWVTRLRTRRLCVPGVWPTVVALGSGVGVPVVMAASMVAARRCASGGCAVAAACW